VPGEARRPGAHTGKQAECYANEFVSLHLETIDRGKTYAEIGDVQTALRAQIATAQSTNDPALADLQKQLATATTQRETVFKGETLRGVLLTSTGSVSWATRRVKRRRSSTSACCSWWPCPSSASCMPWPRRRTRPSQPPSPVCQAEVRHPL